MDDGARTRRNRWGLAGAAILVLASGAPSRAQPASCERYAVHGLSVGSTLGAVRGKLGREGVTTRITRPGGGEAAAVEYVVGDATVYLEYDRRIDRKHEARVELVRASVAPSDASLAELRKRWGPPTVGAEELERGLAAGPAIWIDEGCGLAVIAYRRQGSWWSGDVGTFVQLESLVSVSRGGSPASAALAAGVATTTGDAGAGADPKAATQAAGPSPSRPPERIASVPPTYPPNLRLMGIKGRVSLAVTVGADGSVEDARVVEAIPAGRGFEAAAVAAVKRWRYRPATNRGVPVAAEVPVVIEFK